ncbi:MAG: fluoride efflux transporter CrcB [Bacteroidales bacterium]|nr:fluoride efflux transporter CrcB [Bacteroidales bacterium]MBQ9878524.1 fluoride efflux transporter CrcB [Bacteroidales bacterium]
MKAILVVGSGSFLGGAARYLISLAMKNVSKGFPWATLLVNVAGCLLIGLLWGWLSRTSQMEGNLSLFLTVGLCGGFTTFSTFSKEALMLLHSGNVWGFAGYVAASVIIGIAFVAAGYFLTK